MNETNNVANKQHQYPGPPQSHEEVRATLKRKQGCSSDTLSEEPEIFPPTAVKTEPSDGESNKDEPDVKIERRDDEVETNVKCSSSGLTTSPASPMQHPTPPSGPRQTVALKDIASLVDSGSDEDSDKSDGEDLGVLPIISRACRSAMWTSSDLSSDDEDENTAADFIKRRVSMRTSSDLELDSDDEDENTAADFNWRPLPKVPTPPESRREPFSQTNVGPTSPHFEPYDIFVEIWDRKIMNHIASETNRNAQRLAARMSGPNSRIDQWFDTTVDELYVFFALILAMGIVVKTRLDEYWNTKHDIFYTPGFHAHMSYDRFCILSKCLHFSNNDDMCALRLDPSEARLFKIQPIMKHLNLKFQSLYIPMQNIALDQSLTMWKGWSDMKQIIPNKAANRREKALKTYEVVCPNGYLWRFDVRKPSPSQQYYAVLRLTEGLEHKGYTLWLDSSSYNSPRIARKLKSLGFDCAGRLQVDCPYLLEALHKVKKQNLQVGRLYGVTAGDVDVMVWEAPIRVAMLSTYHGNFQQTIDGSNKPNLLLDCNTMMGHLDKKDKMLAAYAVERKCTKVWYKRLFLRLLNVSVLNSFIICSHISTLTQQSFRNSLVNSILSKHAPTAVLLLAEVKMTKPHIDVTHRLDKLPLGERQRHRRVCVICKKLTSTHCVGCSKTVCIEPCFLTLHSKSIKY